MTDQERLEEIKNVRWENLKTSQILHVKWLIERAQELENLNDAFDDLDSDYIDLHQQNKRYREKINVALALLESVPFRQPEASSAVKHLNKALEESK